MQCPASDGGPTGRCELKPRSEQRTTATRRIPVTDQLRSFPPSVCGQQTVTFPPHAGAKYAQSLPFGSPKWEATYHTLRNTIEGANGILKDGAGAGLEDPRRRRIRGRAAQTLITAIVLVAMNLRSIESFVRNARPDSDGTMRRPRRRRRSTPSIRTWNPASRGRNGALPP